MGHRRTVAVRALPELGGHSVSPQNGNPHNSTIIYLHGFTGNGQDYLCSDSDLRVPWRLGESYAPGLRAVLPCAPALRQPWGEEIPSWYIYATCDSNSVGNSSALEAMREQLDGLVRSEIERLSGAAERLFLGGCSQGCTMALDTYLRHAADLRLGGFVGSVGFLPSDAEGFARADEALAALLRDVEQAQRPLWLQCAPEDAEEVPWTLVESSLKKVRKNLPGLAVRKLEDVGHDIGEHEATFINDFLNTYASDCYFEDESNILAEEDEWDEWDDLDIDIELDVGPSIPGINA